MRLRTADGVLLTGWHVPPPVSDGLRPDVAVLVAHGFTGSHRRPEVQNFAAAFAASAGVLVLDLRGHGGSAGLSTLGDREALDVDAGLRALRTAGYDVVVAVGASMGASAVLRQAGLSGDLVRGFRLGGAPDLVVAVSATSHWGMETEPGREHTRAARRVRWMAVTRPGRRVARALGARIDPDFWTAPHPPAPVEVIAAIDPATLLVVHGTDDHYFTLDHPRALLEAAGEGAELWEIPGFGHAENAAAADPATLRRIADHVAGRSAAIAAGLTAGGGG